MAPITPLIATTQYDKKLPYDQVKNYLTGFYSGLTVNTIEYINLYEKDGYIVYVLVYT